MNEEKEKREEINLHWAKFVILEFCGGLAGDEGLKTWFRSGLTTVSTTSNSGIAKAYKTWNKSHKSYVN